MDSRITKGQVVLFVDDDETMLESIRRLIDKAPFSFRFAHNSEEALAIMLTTHVNVMVTDLCMPEISGADLLSVVHRKFPETAIVVCSGIQDAAIHDARKSGKITDYISKPWDFSEEFYPAILRALHKVIDQTGA